MAKLDEFCKAKRLRAEVKFGGAPDNPDFRDCQGWMVTLRYRGRQLTIPFYTGSLHGEPTVADVVSCLILDAEGVKCARSFEDLASDLGYDPDSRKAEKVFKACEREQVKIERLLGDDYQAFAEAARDY